MNYRGLRAPGFFSFVRLLSYTSSDDEESMQCLMKSGQMNCSLACNKLWKYHMLCVRNFPQRKVPYHAKWLFPLRLLKPAREAALSLWPDQSISFRRKLIKHQQNLTVIRKYVSESALKGLTAKMNNPPHSKVTLKVLIATHQSPCLHRGYYCFFISLLQTKHFAQHSLITGDSHNQAGSHLCSLKLCFVWWGRYWKAEK